MHSRKIVCFLMVVGGIFYLSAAPPSRAGGAGHLVISEAQTTGGAGLTANDFIEIYNPTSAPVDLNGMRLVKRTATGATDTTLKSWTTPALLPAHGYYLWANSSFTSISATPDATTTGTIADNNGVALRLGPENTGAMIDSVAWGTAANAFVEGSVFPQNPGANQSIERKPGGADGNGTDTDINADDFVLQVAPNPQNTASPPAPPAPPPPPPPPPPPAPSPGDLVINEFVPNPTDGIEWIELYNKTSAAVDLTGWKLFDGTGSSIKSLSGAIGAGGFVAFDLSSARLNNDGDIIILQSPAGAAIDSVSYGNWNDGAIADNAPAPGKAGQSVARKSNGGDTGVDKDDFALSDGPTKGASNIILEIIPSGASSSIEVVPVAPPVLVINEFVSDPAEGQEWVELYNAGTVSVDLAGWFIEEGAGSKTALSGTLVPGQFKVVEPVAGNLNNAGDLIALKDPKEAVVDKVSYGDWEDGSRADNAPAASDPNATARRADGADTNVDADDFTVTATPTKGASNVVGSHEVSSDSLRGITINEALPNPVGSDVGEWVELYNSGESPVSLAGAVLKDEAGATYTFKTPAMVEARGFFVLNRETSAITLNNNSETLSLIAPDGTLLDRVQWEGAQEGLAFARSAQGWSWTSLPTPGKANVVQEPKPVASGQEEERTQATGARAPGAAVKTPVPETVGKLLVNELLPNPEGSDEGEFIELYWIGAEPLSLKGFQIDDGELGSRPFSLPEILVKPRYHVLLPRSLTKITLNNTGDAVRLFDPAGALIDEIEYEGSLEGRSFARRADGKWFWTEPSPGKLNVFGSDATASAAKEEALGEAETDESAKSSPRRALTLGDVRDQPVGTRVRTEGIVIAPPGIFGSQIFYINGMQIYMFKKDFPPLALGDKVRIDGEVSSVYGEVRLKVKRREDIVSLSQGAPPPPQEITADELGDELEGMLVKLHGTLLEVGRLKATLDDGAGVSQIVIRKTTGIDMQTLGSGTQVNVVGIVGRAKEGERVMPRLQADIEVTGQDELVAEGKGEGGAAKGGHPYAQATALAGGGAAVASFVVRRRRAVVGGLRAAAFLIRRGRKPPLA